MAWQGVGMLQNEGEESLSVHFNMNLTACSCVQIKCQFMSIHDQVHGGPRASVSSWQGPFLTLWCRDWEQVWQVHVGNLISIQLRQHRVSLVLMNLHFGRGGDDVTSSKCISADFIYSQVKSHLPPSFFSLLPGVDALNFSKCWHQRPLLVLY